MSGSARVPNTRQDLQRIVAAISIALAPLSYASTATYLFVTRDSADGLLDPGFMLDLSRGAQRLFALSMCFDALGLYTLLLVVGGYLWARLRPTSNGLDDVAVLGLGLFSALGITGAMLVAVALPTLSRAHAAADPATRAAAEVTWAISSSVERGLWVFEYLPLAVWCLATAPRLRSLGMRHGWMLTTVGAASALFFAGGVLQLLGVVPEDDSVLVEAPALLGLAVTPLWALLSGFDLLCGDTSTG